MNTLLALAATSLMACISVCLVGILASRLERPIQMPTQLPPVRIEGPGIEVLALVKGTERYVFLYDDESRAELLRTLGRYASNPELSFTWYDAALLSHKVRERAAA